MRQFLLFVALAGGVVTARADLVVTLDFPSQTGSPGDTLVFNGILSNTGLTLLFLNSVDLNLAGNSFTPDFIGPFLSNVPVSLDPGQSTLHIELFDILLNNPFTDLPGTFAGTYTLLGGVDSNAQDVLRSTDFMVTETNGTSAVPEPSSVILLATILGGLVILHRRRLVR